MSRLIILGALLTSSLRLWGSPELVNGAAALVGKNIISIQDAYVFRSLQRFRVGQKPAVLIEADQVLKATVEKLALEDMIVAEAKSLDFKDPDPEESRKLLRLQTSKGNRPQFQGILNRFEISEAEALRRLQKTLLAEKFLKKKIDALTPIITESDINLYISNNPDKVKILGAEAKNTVAALLKKERAEKGLQGWIQFLTEKYSATLLLP
ncbi:MAG: hypothetical protein EB078_02030 [Proteobacteria bacterium]|nr:hypothetical protein [Pseudomonadota bacterium]NDC23507.1 hypothetical protein [Pseudomonadota bacterium]NDD03660.1 hypothetical protein [Pseudomonadota bacterium]NDG26101.1 hypothetical protein [Pseudomonadota bacterium]